MQFSVTLISLHLSLFNNTFFLFLSYHLCLLWKCWLPLILMFFSLYSRFPSFISAFISKKTHLSWLKFTFFASLHLTGLKLMELFYTKIILRLNSVFSLLNSLFNFKYHFITKCMYFINKRSFISTLKELVFKPGGSHVLLVFCEVLLWNVDPEAIFAPFT